MTHRVNWLMNNDDKLSGLITGNYPNEENLEMLLKRYRVNIFVDLTCYCESRDMRYDQKLPSNILYHRFPIRKCNVVSDNNMTSLCTRIMYYINNGYLVYVHSFDGYNRNISVCSIVISHMFKFNFGTTIKIVKCYHPIFLLCEEENNKELYQQIKRLCHYCEQ